MKQHILRLLVSTVILRDVMYLTPKIDRAAWLTVPPQTVTDAVKLQNF